MSLRQISLFVCLLFFISCYHSSKKLYYTNLLISKTENTMKNVTTISIIGDSLSEYSNGFSLQEKLGSGYKVNDFAISGRTTIDWLNDLYFPLQTPSDIILIELGTNDAFYDTKDIFAQNLNKLLSSIHNKSNAKILLTLIPLTEDTGIRNTIREYNNHIRSLPYPHADIEKAFSNYPVSILYPSFDPIHPTKTGYNIMGDTYKEVILTAFP